MTEPTQELLDSIEKKARVDESVVRAALSRVPPSWTFTCRHGSGGIFVRGTIQVIYTVLRYEDGRVWVHASLCGRRGEKNFYLPSYEDVKRVKHDFIGSDRWAYQVFPNERNYVNQNPYVLHLYALMDGEPALPDFTWGLGTI